MKKIVRYALIITIGLTTYRASAQDWQLVWQDEFNGGISPDWVFETGTGSSGWGNNELQYYRRENATVENGNLVITARRQDFGGQRYTSARMKTQGRRSFRYGKIEARLSVPYGSGFWPAFWMLGNDISSVGWPACGEIDIMEHVNTEDKTYGTIHWQDNNGNYAQYGGDLATSVQGFHTYAIEWDDQAIKWFFDGQQFHEVDIANGINGTSEFQNEFFLLLNLAVGGNWPGFNIDESRLPAQLRVDYVRVYQRGGSGGSGGGGTEGIVTLFPDCPYQGTSVGLGEGNYTLNDLQARGMANDDISSLRVRAGYEAVLYWDNNFQGRSLTVRGDNNCLTGDGFNDQLSSIRVRRASGGEGESNALRREAEQYVEMSGVQTEPCSEGGQNVAYIDQGDWMTYGSVRFPQSGTYEFEYRVASPTGGALSSDLNGGETVLGEVSIPATGGWQNWTTVRQTAYVNAGTYPFGIYARQSGWNINWWGVKLVGSARTASGATTPTKQITPEAELSSLIYPNPVQQQLRFTGDAASLGSEISIRDLSGRLVRRKEAIDSSAVDVADLPKGTYVLTLYREGQTTQHKFIKE